jgi:2-dehydropantoate 2-reductase
VDLLLRPALADAIARHGLRISDIDGTDRLLPSSGIGCATEPDGALAGADIVLVTVKSGGTAEMGELIARHASPTATIVSLQNGVENVAVLRARAGSRRVVAGTVAFHVAQTLGPDQPLRLHRSTTGAILIEAGVAGLQETLDAPGARTVEHGDMPAIQWGKLLLNLNNAFNALSGLPLAQQLAERSWRRLLARQMDEALATFKVAGIGATNIDGIPVRVIPWLLRLPDWLFRLVARRMLAIDPAARSSMWDDLEKRRRTEIDYLQGAVLDLARKHGVPAPLTKHTMAAVKAAEASGSGSPRLRPGILLKGAGMDDTGS